MIRAEDGRGNGKEWAKLRTEMRWSLQVTGLQEGGRDGETRGSRRTWVGKIRRGMCLDDVWLFGDPEPRLEMRRKMRLKQDEQQVAMVLVFAEMQVRGNTGSFPTGAQRVPGAHVLCDWPNTPASPAVAAAASTRGARSPPSGLRNRGLRHFPLRAFMRALNPAVPPLWPFSSAIPTHRSVPTIAQRCVESHHGFRESARTLPSASRPKLRCPGTRSSRCSPLVASDAEKTDRDSGRAS